MGLDVDPARPAHEPSLIEGEAPTGPSPAVSQPIRADSACGAAGGYVLDYAIVVPMPDLARGFVEKHRELGAGIGHERTDVCPDPRPADRVRTDGDDQVAKAGADHLNGQAGVEITFTEPEGLSDVSAVVILPENDGLTLIEKRGIALRGPGGRDGDRAVGKFDRPVACAAFPAQMMQRRRSADDGMPRKWKLFEQIEDTGSESLRLTRPREENCLP